MNEILLGALGIILAADVTFLIAYLTTISSKFEMSRDERRELLNEKFISKIIDIKDSRIDIDLFLPIFEEYKLTEDWGNRITQIHFYFSYSIIFTIFGLILGSLDIIPPFGGVPIESLFIIVGGFLLLWAVFAMVNLGVEIHNWKRTIPTDMN